MSISVKANGLDILGVNITISDHDGLTMTRLCQLTESTSHPPVFPPLKFRSCMSIPPSFITATNTAIVFEISNSALYNHSVRRRILQYNPVYPSLARPLIPDLSNAMLCQSAILNCHAQMSCSSVVLVCRPLPILDSCHIMW